MGSYAYILVAAFIMTGSIFMISQRQDTNRADVDLGRVQMKQEARNAANTGLSLTIRALAQDQDPWLVPSNYEFGPALYSYEEGKHEAAYQTVVTIVDSLTGDTLDVVATGTKVYTGRNGLAGDTTHIIEARIARGVLVNATPPGFRAAVVADFELRVHGDFSLNALVPGVNADMHTNGDLRLDGNSFAVAGMGTYTGSSRINRQQEDNFQPVNDWNGDASNVFQRDSIPLPTWHVNDFRTDAQAKGYYTSDPLVVNGTDLANAGVTTVDDFAEMILGLSPGDYGTDPKEPFLVMVDNTLDFEDAVNLSGYVQFGATGDIDIHTSGPDDGLFMSYTLDIPNQTAYTHAGLFTTAGIRVEGNATIQGTMYAEGSITYLGGTHLIGGQVAKETTFQGGGTVDIDWVGAGPGITEYFDPYEEPIGPVIVSYAEW